MMWNRKQVGRRVAQWMGLLLMVALPSAASTAQQDTKYTPTGSNSFMYPGEPVPEDEMRITIFGSGYGYVRGD